MNIEQLKESIISDLIDTNFIIKKNKEDFINNDISPADYLTNRAQSYGYKVALETILNRIEVE
jgi:hypothetical protein